MSTPRRKILITTDFAWPHPNGVAQVVGQIVEAFPDCDCTILTYAQPGLPAREQHGNATIIRMGGKGLLGDTLRIPVERARLERHDIVITNTRFFTLSALGARLARKWRVPHIHLEHGTRHVPHHNSLVRAGAWAYDHSVGRMVVSHATVVVCIARAGFPFARKLGAKRVLLIPNGIAVEPFALPPSAGATVRRELGLTPTDRMVLYVGRLVREKGVQDLITALASRPTSERWVLVAIGAGPARATFETQARKRGVRAVFLGVKEARALPAYYHAADVFVNPSWAEGLPTTVLEALAARTRIIATAVGGTPEVLPRPSLVPAHAPKAIAAALSTFESLPRDGVPPRFTLQAMQAAWRSLVYSLLDPQGAATPAQAVKTVVRAVPAVSARPMPLPRIVSKAIAPKKAPVKTAVRKKALVKKALKRKPTLVPKRPVKTGVRGAKKPSRRALR